MAISVYVRSHKSGSMTFVRIMGEVGVTSPVARLDRRDGTKKRHPSCVSSIARY